MSLNNDVDMPLSTESSPNLITQEDKETKHIKNKKIIVNKVDTPEFKQLASSNYIFNNISKERNTTLIILNGDASVEVLKKIKRVAEPRIKN